MSGNRAHRGKHAELDQWIADRKPSRIGPTEWDELRATLEPVSPTYLRRLLRDLADETGLELDPTVEGVRQHDFPALKRSLTALTEAYEASSSAERQQIRMLVIEAKDHARLAGRNPDKTATKKEMVLWMLTWLENPPLFPNWVAVRDRVRDPALDPTPEPARESHRKPELETEAGD